MFEKVNPAHPDKVADRIAGAVVDIAYETQIDPKVAVEVLIGHGICHIIAETSAKLNEKRLPPPFTASLAILMWIWWWFPRTPIWPEIRKMRSAAATTASSRVCL